MMRQISFAIGFTCLAGMAPAQPQAPGQALFQKQCATCHSVEGGAPAIDALNAMPTERIFDALMNGQMKDAAAGMKNRERRMVAEFLGKRALVDPAAGDVAKMTNRCSSNPALGDVNATPQWSGWGGAGNARFQT